MPKLIYVADDEKNICFLIENFLEKEGLQFLADQFELTGSNIKNIAVNSAFLAAADGREIDMSHILRALQNEFQKSGKRLTGAEMGQYGMV